MPLDGVVNGVPTKFWREPPPFWYRHIPEPPAHLYVHIPPTPLPPLQREVADTDREDANTDRQLAEQGNQNAALEERIAAQENQIATQENQIAELMERIAKYQNQSVEQDVQIIVQEPEDYQVVRSIASTVQRLAYNCYPDDRAGLRGMVEPDLINNKSGPWLSWAFSELRTLRDFRRNGYLIELTKDPELDMNVFPYVPTWAPGQEQNDFDIRYGGLIPKERLEAYEPESATTMPIIPNLHAVTHNPNGDEYVNCSGDTVWTNGELALERVCRRVPPMKWYENENGQPILRWATKSRTISRTIEYWQRIPKGAVFKFRPADLKDVATNHGPAWTCYSASVEHKRKTSIMPFWRKSCDLCGHPRHHGHSRPHDFFVPDTEDFSHVDHWQNEMEKKARKPSSTSDLLSTV